jgi:hypothetical protein
MVINRNGITRIVILIGRWAIKVPCVRYSGQRWRCFLRGLLANMQERDVAATGWPELCPVLFAVPGGLLIVMRRASAMSNTEWDAFRYDNFITLDGGRTLLPVENKPDSFGWLDGRVVAVDYGGFAY